MKTLIKLAIVFLILNATFQAGRAYVSNYQFEDDMQQAALFAGPRPNAALVLNRVLEHAEERGIPIGKDDVEVTIDRSNLNIRATWSQEVQLVPGLYRRTFVFQPSVNARLLNP
jgi:hypothetical protein